MRIASWAAMLACAAAVPALADCHWEWLCNGEGACKHMPVCDTLFDKAPPRPESTPPSPPPIRMRPHNLTGSRQERRSQHAARQHRALRDALEGMKKNRRRTRLPT